LLSLRICLIKHLSVMIHKNSSDKLEAQATALGTEWARLPRAGQRLDGMARSYLYELIAEGKIRSHVIRKQHCVRGIRLVNLPSLRAYIASAATGATTQTSNV
jgi:hypothetical protein